MRIYATAVAGYREDVGSFRKAVHIGCPLETTHLSHVVPDCGLELFVGGWMH